LCPRQLRKEEGVRKRKGAGKVEETVEKKKAKST